MTREGPGDVAGHPRMMMGHPADFGLARDRVLTAQVRQARFAARSFGRAGMRALRPAEHRACGSRLASRLVGHSFSHDLPPPSPRSGPRSITQAAEIRIFDALLR